MLRACGAVVVAVAILAIGGQVRAETRDFIVGGAGFIGSAFVWKLNSEGVDDVLIVDELGTSDKWKNLVGLRYSLGLMWVLLIVAETISASSGIGYMTTNAREFLQTDVVLVGILMYALLGKLADVATRRLERVCLRWHPSYQ